MITNYLPTLYMWYVHFHIPISVLFIVNISFIMITELPECGINMTQLTFTGEKVKLQCEFKYRAPWPPTFEWRGPRYSLKNYVLLVSESRYTCIYLLITSL